MLFAELYHSVKLGAVFSTHTGDALVGKDTGKLPAGVVHDFLCVVFDLHVKAAVLFLFFSANTAVSGYTQFFGTVPLTVEFWVGGYFSNSLFRHENLSSVYFCIIFQYEFYGQVQFDDNLFNYSIKCVPVDFGAF